MALPAAPYRAADELDEIVPRLLRGRARAGPARATAPVGVADDDARQVNAGAFLAPDRTVAVPDAGRRAGEGLARSHDLQRQEQAHGTDLRDREESWQWVKARPCSFKVGRSFATLVQSARLLEVEVALELVKHFVLDQALAMEADQLGPAGGDRRQDEVEMGADVGH